MQLRLDLQQEQLRFCLPCFLVSPYIKKLIFFIFLLSQLVVNLVGGVVNKLVHYSVKNHDEMNELK